MKSDYRSIPLHLIDVPADRLRETSTDRVETLSKDIEANGLLQPIGLVEESNGRFVLMFGAHRLAAFQRLMRDEIDARVTPAAWIKAQERRVIEIMENLNREQLTKLQRAESLADLKRVYEELHPETKKGVAGGKARQGAASEIFSFAKEAAARTGLDKRSIEVAVQIVRNLGEDTKTRVRGTWLADHQAGLKLLSGQTADMQEKVCDLLFATPPEASNVAEAIILAEGRRLPSAADKLFASVQNSFGNLSDKQRFSFFDLHEHAVRSYAQEKGWL